MAVEHDSARSDLDLLVRVAESYYLDNRTQSQIAELLGVSPSTVSRLLSRARDEGIVRINIIRPQGRQASLEEALCQRFGLHEAIVAGVPSVASDDDTLRRALGSVAAPYIDSMIKPGMIVGVGRGRTLAALVEALQLQATPRHITIAQVMGDYDSQQAPARSAELARQIAELYAGSSYLLNAPAMVEAPALAEVLMRAPGVSQVLPFYDRLDMLLVGVGALRGSALEMNGLLTPDQIAELEAAGVVGDICGHFLAADGRLVDDVYPGRAIGISAAQVRRCPRVVVVAAGDGKVRALRALLDARLLHVLVTDERTAVQIMNGQ